MSAIPQNSPLAIPDLTKFYPTAFDLAKNHGFIAATSAYMAAAISNLEVFMSNSMKNSQAESSIQHSITDNLRTLSKEVQTEWAAYEANKPSNNFLSKVLGYMLDGFMLLLSIVTADPVLFAMTSTMIAMQASGLQNKLNNALPANSGLRALCELGIAAGEAFLFGGIDVIAENGLEQMAKKEAEQAGQNAAAQAAKTSGERVVSALKTYSSLLAQSLLMGGFWFDTCKAVGMSDQDAAIFGMLAGAGLSAATCFASMDSGCKSLLRERIISKWGQNADRYLDRFQTAINLGRDIIQGAEAVEDLKQAQMMKIVARIFKEMGLTQSKFSLFQSLLQMWGSASSLTQNTTATLITDFESINQSFGPLGQMMSALHK